MKHAKRKGARAERRAIAILEAAGYTCTKGGMAGSGRICERAGIYFIAYSHGGHEFRESTRSRNIEDAKRLLASRIVTVPPPGPSLAPAPAPDPPSLTFDQLAQLYLNVTSSPARASAS